MIKKIHHLGYAVSDLDAAVRFYREGLGVGPAEVEVLEEQGIVAATFRVGDVEIELLQPTHPDSPVGRFLDKRGEGFHHVAYLVEDLDAALRTLEKRGAELVDRKPRTGLGGRRMAFVHPGNVFGVLTELVEESGGG